MPDPIEVRISDCRCPGGPHPDGDLAYLRPFLDYAGGAEALRAMRTADGDVEKFDELVGPVYIRRGMLGWNRLDEAGEPVPVPDDPATAMPYDEAYWLAEKADDLYGGSVLAPLVKQLEMSSRTGPTGSSPSTTSRSRSTRRKRSGSSPRLRSADSTSSTD